MQHNRAKGGTTQAMQPSLKPPPTTTTPSHSPHKRGHGHSLPACTHTHTRAKAGQGAHHHQANGVDGLHSDHGVAQAWLWCGVAIKPCATRGGTHAIQVATCSPHCPTTTTTPVLSGVNTRATTSPHPSPLMCVTVALSHPPCPQVWSSTTVRPASPPPGPSSTTIHQSAAAPAAQEQESVVTQMDEGMEAHTTHSVVESNTANQHTSTHTSGHTNTSQPPIHHTHTGWMAKGLIARTCEESEKTTPCK